jgi:hypothetical protein
MFSKKEREYLQHLARYGFAFDKYKGDYPYVLKHRIKLKAYHAIQDLKFLASIWYWFEHPRGCPIEGAKAVSLERLIQILEDEFSYLRE